MKKKLANTGDTSKHSEIELKQRINELEAELKQSMQDYEEVSILRQQQFDESQNQIKLLSKQSEDNGVFWKS